MTSPKSDTTSAAATSSDPLYDAVVVGVGGVGSFALRALSRDQPSGKYLGIERYQLHHTHGSSHGRTRVYRSAYFEHPGYVTYCQHSANEFRQLQAESGMDLIQECGTLLIEPVDGAVEYGRPAGVTVEPCLPVSSIIPAAMAAAKQHGIPVEHLDHAALQERFPQFNYNNSKGVAMHGLLEPTGGLVRPERVQTAIRRQLDASDSVTILEHTVVNGYQVTTSAIGAGNEKDTTTIRVQIQQQGQNETQTITTKALLIAAGGWTGELIPSWRPYLKPARQLQGWVNVEDQQEVDPSHYNAGSMPTFVFASPDWPTALYGIPRDTADELPHYSSCIKLGIHQRDVPIADCCDNPHTPTAAETNEMEQAFQIAFDPKAWSNHRHNVPTAQEVRPCIYTMTPDANFIVGSPEPGVFGVTGCSGHAYKMTPTLGQIMADFALQKEDWKSTWQVDFLSVERFQKN